MSPSPASTTRLENIRLDRDGIRFDLEGRGVRLDQGSHAPAVAAWQAFYGCALSDYLARASAPAPGPLARLWSWIGRTMGWAPPPVSAAPPLLAPPPERAEPRPQPAKVVRAHPAEKPSPQPQTPLLRAVFADREGVHLVWQPAGKGPGKSVAVTCELDSALAARLQDCYGHLAGLGYKIVGLELLKPELEKAKPSLRSAPEKAPKKEEPGPAPAPQPEAPAPAEPQRVRTRAKAPPAIESRPPDPLPDPV